jgi:hypothetical protein
LESAVFLQLHLALLLVNSLNVRKHHCCFEKDSLRNYPVYQE